MEKTFNYCKAGSITFISNYLKGPILKTTFKKTISSVIDFLR